MKKAASFLTLAFVALVLIGARQKSNAPEAIDPFAQESREGDKPYAIVEWVPADEPHGVLVGNASSEIETAPGPSAK